MEALRLPLLVPNDNNLWGLPWSASNVLGIFFVHRFVTNAANILLCGRSHQSAKYAHHEASTSLLVNAQVANSSALFDREHKRGRTSRDEILLGATSFSNSARCF